MGLVNIYGNATAYNQAFVSGLKYGTGQAISIFLAKAGRNFDVVVLPNGSTFGQMMVDSDPDSPEARNARDAYEGHTNTRTIARPTVFWCADYRFEYYGDVDGVRTDAAGSIYPRVPADVPAGGLLYKAATGKMVLGKPQVLDVPVVRYTKGQMPPWLVLFHELGHVKQFYAPGFTDMALLDAAWAARLLNTAAIEAENLASHENPLCRETAIAERMHYKHMSNGMSDVNSKYEALTLKPALRVATSPVERATQDNELALLVAANAARGPGFFAKPL